MDMKMTGVVNYTVGEEVYGSDTQNGGRGFNEAADQSSLYNDDPAQETEDQAPVLESRFATSDKVMEEMGGQQLAEEDLTEEELRNDVKWQETSQRMAKFYGDNVAQNMPDGEDQTPNLANVSAEYGMQLMSEMQGNLGGLSMSQSNRAVGGMIPLVKQAIDSEDPAVIQDLLYMMERYEDKEWSFNGVGRTMKYLFGEVSNVMGGFGLASAPLKFGAKKMITQQGRDMLMEKLAKMKATKAGQILANNKVKTAAGAAGMTQAGLDNLYRQKLEVAGGKKKEIDLLELGLSGLIGAGVGTTIAATPEIVMAAAKGTKEYYRALEKRVAELVEEAKATQVDPDGNPIFDVQAGGPVPKKYETPSERAIDPTIETPIDLVKAPTITMKDLEGKTIYPIEADLTAGGGYYKGVDAATTDPVPLKGGETYPLLVDSEQSGLVWANKGGASGKAQLTRWQKAAAKSEDGYIYGTIYNMSEDAHQSNNTAVRAYLNTIDSYLRDGRIQPEQATALHDMVVKKGDDLVASGEAALAKAQKMPDKQAATKKKKKDAIAKANVRINSGKAMQGLPDFNKKDHDAVDYAFNLSFEDRKAVLEQFNSKAAQSLGMPNTAKILRATRDPKAAGRNVGDVKYVIRFDPNDPETIVKLGEGDVPAHPSFDMGVKGEIVGQFAEPVNVKTLYDEKFNAVADRDPKDAWTSFMREKPSQNIRPDQVENIDTSSYKSIKSPKQARVVMDVANDNWKTSTVSKKDGGISPTDYIDALNASDSSSTLTKYETPEEIKGFKSEIRNGNMDLFQLGDNQIYFGTHKGQSYKEDLGFTHPELTDNETTLVGVVNNEQGAPKGGDGIMAKAIQEGVTALDAFAVPSAKYPEGFLPAYYSKRGFKTLGTVDFDKSYYSTQEYNDIIHQWKSEGWDESLGMPKITIMKYKGSEDARENATGLLLGGSIDDFNAGLGVNGQTSGSNKPGLNRQLGSNGRGDNAGSGQSGDMGNTQPGRSGGGDVSDVYSEINSLSSERKLNLGL